MDDQPKIVPIPGTSYVQVVPAAPRSSSTPPPEAQGTTECPKCGRNTPHYHDPADEARLPDSVEAAIDVYGAARLLAATLAKDWQAKPDGEQRWSEAIEAERLALHALRKSIREGFTLKRIANWIAKADRLLASSPPPPSPTQEIRNLSNVDVDALLKHSLKPEEISGEQRELRVRELLRWFSRLANDQANWKWTRGHAFELAYYIATSASPEGFADQDRDDLPPPSMMRSAP